MASGGGIDAIVVGSGPNGLAAAIALARAGVSVRVLESGETVGGGARSAELTLPGFVHDVCSAIHPLAKASPFLRTLPLEAHGVEWVESPAVLAHPFDDGTAALLERSLEATGDTLGRDSAAWRRLVGPLVHDADLLLDDVLAPPHIPAHPIAFARFGTRSSLPAATLARIAFRGTASSRALRRSRRSLDAPVVPVAERSLRACSRASRSRGRLAARARWLPDDRRRPRLLPAPLGGEIETGRHVSSLAELEGTRTVLLDVAPRGLLALAGDRLPSGYRRRLERYRYGPGAFKLDWALDGPIPWRAEECARAATVHLGATLEEIVASERSPSRGEAAERPFVLLAQQSLFDPTRAPAGQHTAWAYCHVPNGSALDMTERIEKQVERFAPGFRERILARVARGPAEFERYNPNYVGGDINGGAADLRQVLARPVLSGYTSPLPGVFLCSASTPPGGGVHGMCGFHAARAALAFLR